MRVAIHQPAYLPWLGYIEKVVNSDVFVFLDTVAYSKNSFDNRNRIYVDDHDHWLTIPIQTAGKLGQTYLESFAAEKDWKKRHLQTIKQAYRHSKNYFKYIDGIEKMYENTDENASLAEICWNQLQYFCNVYHKQFVLETVTRSSILKPEGDKSVLVLNICKQLGATEYYSGVMGKDYLDEKAFKDAKIKIVYQSYKPKHYYSVIHQLMTDEAKL